MRPPSPCSALNDALVAQSGTNMLTVLAGTAGIGMLSADVRDSWHQLIVNSAGTVHLADGIANSVTVDGAGAVYGGTGNDTITAEGTGHLLYGGGGAEYFPLR